MAASSPDVELKPFNRAALAADMRWTRRKMNAIQPQGDPDPARVWREGTMYNNGDSSGPAAQLEPEMDDRRELVQKRRKLAELQAVRDSLRAQFLMRAEREDAKARQGSPAPVSPVMSPKRGEQLDPVSPVPFNPRKTLAPRGIAPYDLRGGGRRHKKKTKKRKSKVIRTKRKSKVIRTKRKSKVIRTKRKSKV